MCPLRLVNNTGIPSEKNLCFVNSVLQLLNSIPEFREAFTSKRYSLKCAEDTPLIDELSRVLQNGNNNTTSAATLRYLVGTLSEKTYLFDGSQQDAIEFLEILLQELQIELSKVSFEANQIVDIFWGKETCTIGKTMIIKSCTVLNLTHNVSMNFNVSIGKIKLLNLSFLRLQTW